VKKTISIIALSALLLAAVTVLVCTDVKFDNPLDKEGTNYLNGDTSDEKGKLFTRDDGVAALFYDTSKYKQCDGTVPVITLVGGKSVEINTQETAKFRKWMHLDNGPWDSLITWNTEAHKNVNAKQPRLTNAKDEDVPYNQNAVPDAGTYIIDYRIEKPECNGKVPGSNERRTLVVIKYEAPDTVTPTLILLGQGRVEVKEGDKYSDEGVTVMLGSQNITADAVDSVVLKRNTGARVDGWKKPVNFAQIAIPANTPASTGFTITYYASRNGRPTNPASVVRNVTVTENVVVGTKAVIVLNPYKHNIPGVSKTIEHPDTMMIYGGTYSEKGAAAYYEKDGAKVTITEPVTKPNPPNTSANSPAARSLAYTLAAGSGYSAADPVTRYVYLVDSYCSDKAAPKIALADSAKALSIPAGVEWNYGASWSVTNMDYDDGTLVGGQSAGRKYLIDFGGMDPKKPAKGTYTITYVGLGGCGSIAVKTRSVKVE